MTKHYYGFELSRVIDPGTLEGVIDLGFNMFLKARVEFFGLIWPRLDSCDLREKEAAKKAIEGLLNIVRGEEIEIYSHSFANGLVSGVPFVWIQDCKINLCEALVNSGFARPDSIGNRGAWFND
tara:strand:+ start:634 stop:1005 length:372 start_codon:yes stop_codon:yes gene_type:complete